MTKKNHKSNFMQNEQLREKKKKKNTE